MRLRMWSHVPPLKPSTPNPLRGRLFYLRSSWVQNTAFGYGLVVRAMLTFWQVLKSAFPFMNLQSLHGRLSGQISSPYSARHIEASEKHIDENSGEALFREETSGCQLRQAWLGSDAGHVFITPLRLSESRFVTWSRP